MTRALRWSVGLYPALGAMLLAGLFLSRRSATSSGLYLDRVFPFLSLEHPPGLGHFLPGSFALNFFLPAWAMMGILNLAVPSLARPLVAARTRLFWYLLGLVVAILDVAADTLIPMLELPGPWRFGLAVSAVHAGFLLATWLAHRASATAQGEW